jgi:beta-lactamase superfamily II metal-dependent hydrolase
MPFEIDFLPVGDGKDGGDAIVLRYGNLVGARNEQKIIVIDGGYKKNGTALVNHIKTYCKIQGQETSYVDLVILTHPDEDHSSGLTEIFDNFKVLELWMHKPWEHSTILKDCFVDKRITATSLEARIKKNLDAAYDIEEAAKKQKEPVCKIWDAYSGIYYNGGILRILAPSEPFYISLIPQFEKTPDEKPEYQFINKSAGVSESVTMTKETWEDEKLAELNSKPTTGENLSSTILLFQYEGKKLLLTADSGTESFMNAITFAQENGIDLSNLDMIQIPHHGSKHNIGKRVLNYLLGKPQSKLNYTRKGFSIASVAKESDIKHPSRKVTNAFRRRGYPAYQTKGIGVNWGLNAPTRNWSNADAIDFYNDVDD